MGGSKRILTILYSKSTTKASRKRRLMKIQHHLQKEKVHTSKCLKNMLEHQTLASSNVTHVNCHQRGFHASDQLTILNTPFFLLNGQLVWKNYVIHRIIHFDKYNKGTISYICKARNRSFCINILALQPKHHQMQINIKKCPTILSNDKK
jgi:hypothetical protein